jgi:hypothetical protein
MLLFDLPDERYVFPPAIAETLQRPDIVLYCEAKRRTVWIELTVPLEDCVTDAQLRKTDRYRQLRHDAINNGWSVDLFTVEVGSRGYVGHSLLRCLRSLGMPRSRITKVMAECSRVALRASYVIYLHRERSEWVMPPLLCGETRSGKD